MLFGLTPCIFEAVKKNRCGDALADEANMECVKNIPTD